MNTQDFLTKIPIFHKLSPTDLDTLTKLWHQRTIPKSNILFHKGDIGSSMFIIEEGTIEITVPAGNKQKDICVSVLKEGDFFGELSLIDGLPRTATATAAHNCKLLEMQREDFIRFILDRPTVAISMLSEMGKRLQATNDLVTSLASRNINVEMDEKMSFGDKLADKVADFVGSWMFVVIFLFGIVLWCMLNVIELIFLPFDPYPFVFLNLVLGLVASLQAPLIMMSQNRAQIKDRLRADLDYQVNLKSELMLQQLHTKIDEIRSEGDVIRGIKPHRKD
jgi:CRP/FNR family transcriptional regulator, cyclic AMP receptor protein